MNQLEIQYQEILHTLDKLLANLGLMLEDYDVEYLTQADLYIEIFKIMFPVLEPVLNADFGEDITDEELIQYLINVLAKDIIKMDLGHIRGELIAQGDAKNILNFLQLLFEISNMVVEKDGSQKPKRSKKNKNKKLVKSSGNSAEQTSNNSERSSLEWNQKYNSVQGINAEFSDSNVTDSNREASEHEGEEGDARYYEDEYAQRAQNKLVFDQHQQMRAMKGESKFNSRSVSRISEVSKSKESSEYERGFKKLSQKFDENPAIVQVKNLVAEGNKRGGSYTSEDIKELRKENDYEDELEQEEEEEEREMTENEYEEQNPGQIEYTNENEGEEQEQDEEEEDQREHAQRGDYDDGEEEDEVIEEDEDGFTDQMMRKVSGEEQEDDLEYYANDPINYHPMGKTNARQEAEREDNRAKAIQAVDKKHREMHPHDQEEEEYEEEEELEQEEQEQEGEFYENEDEDAEEGIESNEGEVEMDPRYAGYREEMEEVAEEEYDEEDTENTDRNGAHYPQEYYEQQQVQQVAKKTKGKGKTKKTKKVAKKKSSKTVKAVEDFKKPKVEYRPLRPATAGMKRPQTASSSKGKVTKSIPIKDLGRKSNDSSSRNSKKMVHSKSEKHLNVGEEEEERSQTQSQIQEEYPEDQMMEPKGYKQEGDSQIPSQHGHNEEYSGIEEEQEQEEEGYQEEAQGHNGNVYKILSENVARVKENLREHRAVEDVPFDDVNTVKMIRQQKEQYKQYLKDFMKDHQIKEKKYQNMRELAEKNFHRKMRSEKMKDESIKREFENQQKSLYYKMRDEKVNYLRRIHKTIFELEKKRIIDEKKTYMEFRRTKNMETGNMIESIKNQYKNKLNILKENNANQQNERKIASEAQRTFLKTLENELRMDQMKEVERLKDKWRLEKERFEMMIKDEGFLEQKVMQLYKRGAF